MTDDDAMSCIDDDFAGTPLQLPEDIQIVYVCQGFYLIEEKIKNLLLEITQPKSSVDAVTGFDCEWKVDAGHFVDVIQIVYKKEVYVFQTNRSWVSLPPSLLDFLADSNIKKAGRQVGSDLSRLNRKYHTPCNGALELGVFCSSRKKIKTGTLSLSSEISFRLLGHKISKDSRLSDWTVCPLTQDLITYAAIDTWASLAIYDTAKNFPVHNW